MPSPISRSFAITAAALLTAGAAPEAQETYQKPPQAVLDILHVPPTPALTISPSRDQTLLVQGVRYPPVADLAQPKLSLAGMRINPRTNGPHMPTRYVSMTLKSVPSGKEQPVDVPENAHLGYPSWSQDGSRFVFLITNPHGIELWVGDAKTGKTHRLLSRINAVYGDTYQWMPDGKSLLCQVIPDDRPSSPPESSGTPTGPIIQHSDGKSAPVRTYQDLLQNAHDEDLFDYYATGQLVKVDAETGKTEKIGAPGIFYWAEPSPDGKHLLVSRLHRPYSYLLPASLFPKEVEVWDEDGKLEYKLASLPLAEHVPIEGVPTGPRGYTWHPVEPATLVWAEALDDGDPRKKVPHRDRIRILKAPFIEEPTEVAKTEHRFSGITWGEHDGLMFLSDYDRDRKWRRTYLQYLHDPNRAPRLVWDRSTQDRYGDPGSPVHRVLPNGRNVMWQHGDAIFLRGGGATPDGEFPFMDKLDLKTLKTERIFQNKGKCYEYVAALLNLEGTRLLTRYETPDDPPNYFLRTVGSDARTRFTDFPDPSPQLRKIKKEIVTYKREDGVDLSFTLYLPPDYVPGTRLPTVLWAYPTEFASADTAGQVSGSPYRFTTIQGTSNLFFLTQGYAVLDNASMPVVGDPETVNNTYVKQIVDSAKAAIDKAAEMGVTDPNRVGVGGHSYGAFMTANLLAHSDLFRAGIARSGAYNRTLTPFGFQSERRTLWEAPEIYMNMSPFMVAHKITEPILLLHGEMDNNSGTFPMQSERLYGAIKGNGGTTRLVMLPYESHGYQARESVEHTLYEMIAWFDKYVKNAPDKMEK